MKFLLLILVIFSFSFVAFGQQNADFIKTQTKTFKNSRQYVTKYDKFKDETSVIYLGQTTGVMLAMSGKSIQINLALFFTGENLKETIPTYILFFTATGKDWTFLKNQRLYVLSDEERFDFGNGDRSSDISRSILGRYQTQEFLYFELPREQLEKFATAKNLELKVSGIEMKIKDSEKTAFSNMLKIGKKMQ